MSLEAEKPPTHPLEVNPRGSEKLTQLLHDAQQHQLNVSGLGYDQLENPKNVHKSREDQKAEAPFTIFSAGEKKLLTFLAGLSMLFSPLTANIYFPAMSQLETDLSASEQMINLTLTVYLVAQGIAPALLGDLADLYGRRLAYLLMFTIYTIANLGLAVQRSWGVLLGLRIVQSLGCSASVAVSYGVIADVATAGERGGMVGVAMVATNLGPALAPLIGGGILAVSGRRWEVIFWFLFGCGGLMLALVFALLPETARNVVANGTVRLGGWWRRPFVEVLTAGKVRIPRGGGDTNMRNTGGLVEGGDEVMGHLPCKGDQDPGGKRRRMEIPNPFRSVRVLFYKDASVVLLVSGIFYAIYYCVQASIAGLFRRIYGLGDAAVGACYLSIGFGVVLGGYCNGRLLDWNYKATARELGIEVNKTKGEDLDKFPIEEARSRSVVWLHLAHLGALLGYGWLVEKKVHMAAPLVFQFVLGFLETCLVQTHNTLLVDIFQDSPSAAAASGNIVRCGLSAGAIAAMEPLMDLMGIGWYFTLLACVGGVFGMGGTYVISTKGRVWRLARRQVPGT